MTESTPSRRRGDLDPNPVMWEALERGKKLREILEDFYAQVYADPRLAPFFVRTTIEWAIDHQYGFLAQIFTGEKMYFGDRPRNAHHWMVISNELFDYREAVMQQCLRRHGLSEERIAEWRAVEEVFRAQIVKDKPFAKKRRGVDLPLDDFEALDLSIGSICDVCQGVLENGSRVQVHRGTGRTYCEPCFAARPESANGNDEHAVSSSERHVS